MRLFVLTLMSRAAGPTPPTVEDLLEAKLLARVAEADRSLGGVLGVYAIDLQTGHTISYHGDSVFPQASSIKIAILIELFRQVREGKQELKAQITLAQREAVPGSGHLQAMLKSHPVTLSVEDLAVAMIVASDNTATNKLIAMVGMANVNSNLERLGYRQTRVQRIMIDADAAARSQENIGSPAEMARLVELIWRGKAVDPEASRRMVEILRQAAFDFRKAVPSNVDVVSKYGELTGVHTETGVIAVNGRPFVLSVASAFLSGSANPVPDIAKLFYEHFATLAKSNKYGNGGVR
jgi:beta-lactamase class A